MRILELRFKNLNSLKGEWLIDFTAPPYSSDGIFAVTGPTGAGKTTIFDAVCLALYGRTPRLPKISKSANEIMSRQTGECFSEATFEIGDGNFRCRWSQRRARKKPDGKLQDPKREISDARTGKILETRIREAEKAIEEKTGMDFDRFTRSMLLAQGGFAAFLQAGPDEKGPILEQITGTEIYSRVSIETHECLRREKQKLEALQAEVDGIVLLSKEELKNLSEELKQKQNSEKKLDEKNKALTKAAAWLNSIGKLEHELKNAETEFKLFRQKQEEFEPNQKKLEKAEKALLLEGEFGFLSSMRERQEKDVPALMAACEALPERERSSRMAEIAVKEAEAALEKRRATLRRERETTKKVRELDRRIKDRNKTEQIAAKEIRNLEGEIQKLGGLKAKTKNYIEKNKSDLDSIEKYLTKHEPDAKLVSEFAGIRETLKNLAQLFDKKRKLKLELEKTRKRREIQYTDLSVREKSLNQSSARIEGLKEEADKISDSITARLDGREIKDARDKAAGLKERVRLLERASEMLAEISTREKKTPGLRKSREDFEKQRKASAEHLKEISENSETMEREVDRLEELATLVRRVRDLESERERLEDGKPCPLCGAESHPYARGNIPKIGESEKRLKETQKSLKKLSTRKSSLKVKVAKLDKDIEGVDQKIEEEILRLEKDKRRASELLQSLNISAAPDKAAEKMKLEQACARKISATADAFVVELEKDEKDLKAKEKNLARLRESFIQEDKEAEKVRRDKSSTESELKRIFLESSEAADQLRITQKNVLKSLKDYGVEKISESQLGEVSGNLNARLKAWQTKSGQKNKLEQMLSALEAELERHSLMISKHGGDLKLKSAAREEILKELENTREERKKLYGDKDADDEETRLDGLVDDSEKTLSRKRELREASGRVFSDLKARVSSLTEAVRKRKAEIEKAERLFAVNLSSAGFQNENDYQAARLSQKERETLSRQAKSLSQKQTELQTRKKDLTSKLSAEREKKVSILTSEQLGTKLDASNAGLKSLGREIGAAKQRLREDAKAKDKHREHSRIIEAQRKERDAWESLHQLIGSADGKKYRNFAQGLTFEIVIDRANRRLGKMTDRYILSRDKTMPLDLNVIDNYQAGEIRSAKNLSGGESFIVSLALALGLSQMAGRKVSVDSLFLDEGFGALDEESLGTALEALSGLRRDGKLIGIISHIPALKERIEVQIQATPRSGGRSELSGPGCRKV